MNNTAFFFSETSLLVKNEDIPLSSTPPCYPVSLLNHDFPDAEIFTIPALLNDEIITGVMCPSKAPLPPSWQAVSVRSVLTAMPDGLTGRSDPAAKLLRAFHIAQWRRESLFCGTCGCKNNDHHKELARLCPQCGHVEYPRIAPAIITLIINDKDEVLLAHNRNFTAGIYSLIAGFAEAGENLESAVIREVREEVNIEVRDLHYLVSQPWPFPNSLMIGFSAHHAGGDIKPDTIEIDDARWFSRDSLPNLPAPGSVSRYLINKWRGSVD